ncbi:hypothetical protein PP935_gp115 [Rhizobium phage RHph_N34]|uniref:Uncharacterized protein n=1 Tax=Rhizobium phage RHph_N34 TaxID=2509586 RepID=A0A7S5UX19_9CAUD|nr:hypothetical protein PP935_gp115 [Rhizobium phage RHph_N34]QIG73890.1 hypothetical protein EVC06_115 [Rhizobium phage RHph_N34]
MDKRIIGIAETSHGVFRLTFNRTVLGDSRGYSRDEAIRQAKSFVNRNRIDGDWKGSTWVEFENVLDPELEA